MTGIKTTLGLVMLGNGALTIAQVMPDTAIEAGDTLARLSAPVLQGIVTVSAVWAVIYLIKLIFERLLPALEKNTIAQERVADALSRCEERQNVLRRSDP